MKLIYLTSLEFLFYNELQCFTMIYEVIFFPSYCPGVFIKKEKKICARKTRIALIGSENNAKTSNYKCAKRSTAEVG